MNKQKIGILLSLLLAYSLSFGQSQQEPPTNFLNRQFQTIKRDIHLVKKCLFDRTCSAQEKKEAQKSFIRLTIEIAALSALLGSIWFGAKKIAARIALNNLITQKVNLFIEEQSGEYQGAIGPNPNVTTKFLQNVLGTNDVYIGSNFFPNQDLIGSKSDDIPVVRPIYDKNNTIIGGIGIRPVSKEEIGIVLFKNAPSSYHRKINSLRKSIAGTPLDNAVNHWPYIFEGKWGITGTESHPGSRQAGPARVITQIAAVGAGYDQMASYILIKTTPGFGSG